MVNGKLTFFLGKQSRKEAVLIRLFHFNGLPGALENDLRLFRSRKICLHKRLPPGFMGSQQFMGIVRFRIDEFLDFRPVHQFIQFFCHSLFVLSVCIL
jgi:hypothetical protein